MMVVKTKKQKAQKSLPLKENLNLRISNTVLKQLNLIIKYQEKNEINIDSLKINHKEFIRNNESIQIITLFTFKNLKVKGNMFY